VPRKPKNPGDAREPIEEAGPSRTGDIVNGEWWMFVRWLKHNNTIEQVHPLLQEVQRTLGSAHLTYATIRRFLDSKDPQFTLRQMQEQHGAAPAAREAAEGGEDGKG